MKRVQQFIFLGFFLIQSVSLMADQLAIALDSIEQGDVDKGYSLLLEQAQAGNAKAQYELGMLILDKKFPDKTETAGIDWLETAVANQHMLAAQMLGKMYLSGFVVPLDHAKGTQYFALAEEFRPQDIPLENECE